MLRYEQGKAQIRMLEQKDTTIIFKGKVLLNDPITSTAEASEIASSFEVCCCTPWSSQRVQVEKELRPEPRAHAP